LAEMASVGEGFREAALADNIEQLLSLVFGAVTFTP